MLHQELEDAVLHGADARVAAFCDWYLSYPTTYRLLGIATAAAARHAVRRRSDNDSLSDAVAQELQAHVARHYEATVLRPGQTDPRLHRALVRSLQRAHQLYLDALNDLDEAVADFLCGNNKRVLLGGIRTTDSSSTHHPRPGRFGIGLVGGGRYCSLL